MFLINLLSYNKIKKIVSY